MNGFEKLSEQQLENAAGGKGGSEVIRKVGSLQSGYLALRNVPVAKSENEIPGTKLYSGDSVLITGAHVQGTASGGGTATYVWVFVPKTGASGYVEEQYLE